MSDRVLNTPLLISSPLSPPNLLQSQQEHQNSIQGVIWGQKIRTKPRIFRVYSRPLLGATRAPNLLPWVFKKVFSLEMIKNGICLGGASKQNAFFSKMVSQKRYTCPQCLKQVLILVKISFAELSFQQHLNIPSLLRSYILTLPWLFVLVYLLANLEIHAFL